MAVTEFLYRKVAGQGQAGQPVRSIDLPDGPLCHLIRDHGNQVAEGKRRGQRQLLPRFRANRLFPHGTGSFIIPSAVTSLTGKVSGNCSWPGLRELDFPKENQAKGALPAQLYDMKAGRGGKENLYREKPEVVAKLLALLEKDVKRGAVRKARLEKQR